MKQTFIIKRLGKEHKDSVYQHYLKLDEESRYTRFCSAFKDEAIARYVNKIDFKSSGIFGVFNDNLEIIGVGECVIDSKSDMAEVAFSVEKEYQGFGLGTKLMERIVRFAKSKDKEHLEMVCLRSNQKSVHLAKKFGLIVRNDGSESFASIDMKHNLPALESFNEKVEDSLSYYAIKQKERINNWETGQKEFVSTLEKVMTNTMELMKPKFF